MRQSLLPSRDRDFVDRHYCGGALLAAVGAWLFAPAVSLADGPALTGIVATANSAFTAADNPGGLTRLQHPEWAGQVTVFNAESSDETSVGSASRSTEGNSTLAVPALYYARPWTDRLAFGISLTVPAGIGSNPGDATIGRYLLERWSLGYASLAPAAGYRANEHLSLGIVLNLNYAVYDYETAVFNGRGQPDGTMKLNAGDFGFGYRLGALYELTPATRLGLVYRSATTSHFSSTPELSGLSSSREAVVDALGLRNRRVSLESRFPQAVLAGAYHEFPGASVTLDLAWVNFSQFGLSQATLGNTSISISNAKYQDIWAGTLGLHWPLNDKWTLRFGVAYASSGLTEENRTLALRLDRIWGAGSGAAFQWTDGRIVALDLTYYNLGDAPSNVTVPGVGTVLSARYSSNYAIGLRLSLRWARDNSAW